MALLRALIFALLLALLLPAWACAYDVLVVESRRDPVADEVLRGFRSTRDWKLRVIPLADYAEVDVARIVREDRPDLVLTIGDDALAATRNVRQTPVVAVLSLALRDLYGRRPNLTGVDIDLDPNRYLALFEALRRTRVGVIYDPARSGQYLNRAASHASRYGIDLVERKIRNPKETLGQLAALKGKIDAIWLIPDPTAVTQQTAESYFLFSQEQQVPVVAFAPVYLRLGAAAVLELDRYDLGRQAGEQALRIIRGTPPAAIPLATPRHFLLKSNPSILKHLQIPASALERLAGDRTGP